MSISTALLQEMDKAHHLHPFSDAKDLNRKGIRVITGGKGVNIWDSEGNQYIDGMAGLWCVNVGYGRDELADIAHSQMRELAFYNTFFQSATSPTIELSQLLSDITPNGMDHVFFTNSGSEANDTIVRLVRCYWYTVGQPKKKVIIGRHYSYHGSTVITASLCGLTNMHPEFDLVAPGIDHISAPYWYRFGEGLSPEQFGLQAAGALEQKILELGPETVAAFIGEPVMGGGGVIVPPSNYWAEIQRICRKYKVLLIADEVICGFGRTGNWFGSDTYGIEPDFMSMAKGLSSGYLPIAAVMVRDHIAEVLVERGGDISHGFTYSGHTVAAAVALANIDILRREKIVDRVGSEIGPYFQSRLRELADHQLVGDVRGVGLLGAVEIVEDKNARKPFDPDTKVGIICREHSYANGLIIRACFDLMVLSSPLIISKAEIDDVISKLRRSLDETAEDLERA